MLLLLAAPPGARAQEEGEADVAARLARELGGGATEDEAEAAPAAAGALLETHGFWRFHVVRETPQVVHDDGRVAHAEEPVIRLPAASPADWMRPEFDDGAWARLRGPMLSESNDEGWKAILARGRFVVADPARVGDLKLSLRFSGGAVVYLNGAEVARAGLPQGPVAPDTLAEPYPESAYFDADGKILFRKGKNADQTARLAQRSRRIAELAIPGARLRQGVNVLAIANLRAPTLQRTYQRFHDDTHWAKIGLAEMTLTAPPGAAATPNTAMAAEDGFALWNDDITRRVSARDYPDPGQTTRPLRIVAARNSAFSDQLVAGDRKPIRGLRAIPSDLRGPGVIPAAAVQVRYALRDGANGAFDSLEETPPAEVAPDAASGAALQPLWVTVSVPADAPAGDYSGALAVSAEGVPARSVPVLLRVADWTLPPARDFAGCLDIVQSPESVALAYDVPLWSDAHFKLLDKSFALLGALGNKTLFISCIRRTHFGNEHAMVRWVRDAAGELHPDFTVAERYLDTAMRHMGRVPGVILLCWEPPYSQGHAGGAGGAGRTYDKSILYSLYDPASGRYSPRQGPAWGTPEARQFWRKLTREAQAVLARRGLEQALLFGLIGDARPTRQAMDDICHELPDARWAVHSHYNVPVWQGYTMGMRIALWGLRYSPTDPLQGYGFGWSSPEWLSYYPREMALGSRLTEYRAKLEAYVGARRGKEFLLKGEGPRGLGRIGADFWRVLKDEQGRTVGSLAGRYPESAWGQLNLNFGVPHILGRGAQGPVATVRSEAFRESQQELEARVFIEKALLDDQASAVAGQELLRRCREALDERIRFANRASWYRGAQEAEAWYIGSDWRQRTGKLFELAAAVKARYGAREPAPNLAAAPADGRAE